MNPKKIFIVSAFAVILVLLVMGVFLFVSIQNIKNGILSKNSPVQTIIPNTPVNTGNTGFVPAKTQIKPPFIQNVSNASDVKVDFHYDGDYLPDQNSGYENQTYYTPPGSTEEFLLASKVKDRQTYAYGSQDSLPIFKAEGSHSYQGTPIYITNPNEKYSLSYLGFKVNDKTLISDLSVELGIDYLAAFLGDNYQGLKQDNNSLLASILGIQTADACGPGLYLRTVGDSGLNFVQESNGIMWYQLAKPIALHDLSLQYADQDCSKMPSYCNNFADDPTDCDKYFGCFYNAKISDLSKGNLRMHVYYKANDKEGILRMQMVNVILSDSQGNFSQATMGQDFDHYYKAYLR